MPSSESQTAALLSRIARGDGNAATELLPLVYDRLRALAGHYMKAERSNHTLNPTALVHEAYLQLARRGDEPWEGRTHFFAIAASEMRRILVDWARSKQAKKRGGDRLRVTLSMAEAEPREEPAPIADALDIDAALSKLSRADPRAARVVELRLFGGLTVEEVADALGVTSRTIRNIWRTARAWLSTELEEYRAR